MLSLAACGGAVERERAPGEPPPVGKFWCDEAHERACPFGHVCTDAPPPVGPCRIPGDTVNVDGSCHPVACRAWSAWCTTGGGGNGACLCAAACEARCAGDEVFERETIEQAMRETGVACSY